MKPYTDVHTEHCCIDHGCKYGSEDCTVMLKRAEQSTPCEYCNYYPTMPENDFESGKWYPYPYMKPTKSDNYLVQIEIGRLHFLDSHSSHLMLRVLLWENNNWLNPTDKQKVKYVVKRFMTIPEIPEYYPVGGK